MTSIPSFFCRVAGVSDLKEEGAMEAAVPGFLYYRVCLEINNNQRAVLARIGTTAIVRDYVGVQIQIKHRSDSKHRSCAAQQR